MAIPNVFKQAGGWVKSHPGYSIGGAGGAVFIGVLLYKQEKAKAKNTASGASSGMQPSGGLAPGDASAYPSYDYLYGFYTGDQGGSSGGSSGSSSGGSSGGTSGGSTAVRAQTNTPWDQQHQGVPLRDSPAGSGNILAYVPWGSSVNISGAAVQGTPNTQGGSSSWLPVNYGGQTGYISALDLVGAGIGAGIQGIKSGWARFMDNHLAIWNSSVNEYGMVN